jgi:hypothetical protein
MRDEKDAKDNSPTRLNSSVPWAVTSVRVLPGHRLFVRFADGLQGEVDVSRLIFGEEPGVFERLRDPEVFARVHIDRGAVTWPGDLDLAPDAMYDAIQVSGVWTPE